MLEKLKGSKGFARDFLLNLCASLLTTGVAQLLIYPLLARLYTDDEYGMILTVMGVANTIVATVGNSLNNVRLMVRADYENQDLRGDFLPLLTVLSTFGFMVMGGYLVLMYGLKTVTVLLLLCFAVLGSFRMYGVVTYRLRLEYRKNLICSLVMAVGNCAGLAFVYVTGLNDLWPLAFAMGEAAGVGLLYLKSDIFKEPFGKTVLFPVTLKKETVLLLTTLTASLLTYLDRLLLLPLLGGSAVSDYTVASFFGKSLGIVMTPMAGVLLSYYAQRGFRMTVKRFWVTNGTILLLAGAFFLVCTVFSDWGTGLIYPTLISQARPYLLIANAAAILIAVGNMTQPSVLKFAPTYWQLIVEGVYCAVYLGGGVMTARTYGLWGFSYAVLLAAAVRLLMLYAVGHFSLKKGGSVQNGEAQTEQE